MNNRPWWDPDTSWHGAAVMWGIALLALYVGTTTFALSYFWGGVSAVVAGIITGVLWNIVAGIRGTKKSTGLISRFSTSCLGSRWG